MTALIEAQGLNLHYGRKQALDDLSFAVQPGRVVGLLGHNGAGKTTLMKALVGLHAAQGRLSVLGRDRPRTAERCQCGRHVRSIGSAKPGLAVGPGV